MLEPFTIVAIGLIFLLAGFVKGAVGLGLPTIAIGLLSLLMTPAEAAALLVVPTIVTNIWQAAVGPYRNALLRRLWPMFLCICIGVYLGGGILTSGNARAANAGLGAVLAVYAVLGLTAVRFAVKPGAEPWLSPLMGIATGIVAAATGVFGMPAVPYLQAIGLDKEELVQALGLSFTVSAIALAVILTRDGAMHLNVAGASLLALAPALLGMWPGQVVRTRARPELFRFWFFLALLVLGVNSLLRAVW
jgi:uncharacterized membrane protein YfcA